MAVWQGALSWCSIQVCAILAGHDEPFLWVVQGPHDSIVLVCPWGTNSLWTTPWLSKKQISMVLIFNLLILAFFGRGELLVCHSELCRLVSGSYSKIHVSSPVMTCLKKIFVIFDAFKKVQAHIPSGFLLFIGENFWDQLGTNFLHAQFEGQNFIDGFGDSNSTHYWSLWLSNVDQTSRDPSLWSHFLPFLTWQVFQNEVRLPHSQGQLKMLYAN